MASPIPIPELYGMWQRYRLSLDGKELVFQAGRWQITFRGIVCLALRPAPENEQKDEDKEVRTAERYRLIDHRVPKHPIVAESWGTTVEIGPPYLPLRISGDWNRVKKFAGFHLEGDSLAVTLICHEWELAPLDSQSNTDLHESIEIE